MFVFKHARVHPVAQPYQLRMAEMDCSIVRQWDALFGIGKEITEHSRKLISGILR